MGVVIKNKDWKDMIDIIFSDVEGVLKEEVKLYYNDKLINF